MKYEFLKIRMHTNRFAGIHQHKFSCTVQYHFQVPPQAFHATKWMLCDKGVPILQQDSDIVEEPWNQDLVRFMFSNSLEICILSGKFAFKTLDPRDPRMEYHRAKRRLGCRLQI